MNQPKIGRILKGVITARMDVSKAPWPQQKWEACEAGENPLECGESGAPISITEILSATIVEPELKP